MLEKIMPMTPKIAVIPLLTRYSYCSLDVLISKIYNKQYDL